MRSSDRPLTGGTVWDLLPFLSMAHFHVGPEHFLYSNPQLEASLQWGKL